MTALPNSRDVYARLDALEKTLTERIRALGTRIESQKLWNGATLSDLRELQTRFDALCKDVAGMTRCSESNVIHMADEVPDTSREAVMARARIGRALANAKGTDVTPANYPDGCFIAILGDFIEGATFYGPFAEREAAEHFAERVSEETWTVIEINRLG